MKETRKIGLLSLLLVAALFVQNASAALLPVSTFGDAEGWQGSRSYSYDVVGYGILSGRVYFTVYDSDNLVLEGEKALDDEWTMPGKYIYAYQIFNDQFTFGKILFGPCRSYSYRCAVSYSSIVE